MDKHSITDEQIEALRAESGEAGDHAMCAICDVALDRFAVADWRDLVPPSALGEIAKMTADAARAECARVIAAAQAMG